MREKYLVKKKQRERKNID